MAPLMVILACAMAGGAAAIAFWRPPRLPRGWPLLVVALVPPVGSIFGLWLPGMFLAAMGVLGLWCLWNRSIPGIPIIGLGIGLNLLVMAIHRGAMPIHTDLLAQWGEPAAPGTLLRGSKDVAVASSPLWMLSDWIVVPLGGKYAIVASPGDLLAVFGVAWWLMRSRQSGKGQSVCSPQTSNILPGCSTDGAAAPR